MAGQAKGKKQAKKPVPVSWRDRVSPADYEGLRDTFLIFDEDGSGKIDPIEINKVFEQLDLHNRNPFIEKIITALREKNKPLDFEEFVDCVCSRIGEYKTKDGLKRIFSLYDTKEEGYIGFEELKQIARTVGEYMDDEALLSLMHACFITHQTESN